LPKNNEGEISIPEFVYYNFHFVRPVLLIIDCFGRSVADEKSTYNTKEAKGDDKKVRGKKTKARGKEKAEIKAQKEAKMLLFAL